MVLFGVIPVFILDKSMKNTLMPTRKGKKIVVGIVEKHDSDHFCFKKSKSYYLTTNLRTIVPFPSIVMRNV